MKTGIKTKEDYSIMSDKVCKVCGRPLKYNVVSRNPNADKCFVCFQISRGKIELTETKRDINGNIISVKVRKLKDMQKENIAKYKGGKR